MKKKLSLPKKRKLTKNEKLLKNKFIVCSMCGYGRKNTETKICIICNHIKRNKRTYPDITPKSILTKWKFKLQNGKNSDNLFTTALPRRYEHLLENDWDYVKINDKMLYIFGRGGTGKTTKAYSLWLFEMYNAFLREWPIPPDIVNVPILFQKIKSSFSGNNSWNEKSVNILEHYQKVPWLCLDDIGVMNSTQWEYKELYNLLNYRYEECLPTMFTSNLSLKELENSLGDNRLTRRIADLTITMEMK